MLALLMFCPRSLSFALRTQVLDVSIPAVYVIDCSYTFINLSHQRWRDSSKLPDLISDEHIRMNCSEQSPNMLSLKGHK